MTETREGTDVVERLTFTTRPVGDITMLDFRPGGCRPASDVEIECLAEITRLRSENEALKEVLRPFFDGFSYDPGHSDLDNEQPISVRVQLGDWRRARRHLTARKEGQGGGA